REPSSAACLLQYAPTPVGRGAPLARGSLSPTITTRSTPQEVRPAASLLHALSDGRLFSMIPPQRGVPLASWGPARSVSLGARRVEGLCLRRPGSDEPPARTDTVLHQAGKSVDRTRPFAGRFDWQSSGRGGVRRVTRHARWKAVKWQGISNTSVMSKTASATPRSVRLGAVSLIGFGITAWEDQPSR